MIKERRISRTDRDQLSEEELRRIEADPEFQHMMKESIRAEREGRTFTNAQVKSQKTEVRSQESEEID